MMNAAGTAANYDVLSWKRYAMAIIVTLECPFNGTANDWWALFKAATEDKKFEYTLTWGAYSWAIVFYNMRFDEADVTVFPPDETSSDTRYVIVGSTWLDLANPTLLPKISVTDGSVYA
jgi:hypothetical protein